MKPTAWILTGPTASGKTSLSLRLAEAYGCEIICMDSMQIYRGMDIGTAKPTEEERRRVPHYMIDVADPGTPFSVAQYTEMALQCADSIMNRGRIPLFVGGTGFYLRALRSPMPMGNTAAHAELRAKMEEQAAAPGGKEKLHDRLREVDPRTAEKLHVNDVRRVIRALEVYESTGRPFSSQEKQAGEARFDFRTATLDMDRRELYRRVDLRVDAMIASGLCDEIRRLMSMGLTEDDQAMKAIGYKELIPWIQGRCALADAVDELKKNTRHYAKRQLTWMRREPDVLWVDALAPDAMEKLSGWYTEEHG